MSHRELFSNCSKLGEHCLFQSFFSLFRLLRRLETSPFNVGAPETVYTVTKTNYHSLAPY